MPACHCCSAETATYPVPVGSEFCCDSSIGIFAV